MRLHGNIHFHASQELLNYRTIDAVTVDHQLKTVQNGIKADALLNGFKSVFSELIQQENLVGGVEGVHDFITETHESIDGIDWIPQPFIEAANAK